MAEVMNIMFNNIHIQNFAYIKNNIFQTVTTKPL